jgi:hypothetical protein
MATDFVSVVEGYLGLINVKYKTGKLKKEKEKKEADNKSAIERY